MDKSFAKKNDTVRVLQIAKIRQIRAFAKDRPALSAPVFLPAWLLFIRRSPINIVRALEKKSDPTILRAVDMLPEKLREVINVTVPAITRHIIAFTADLAVVSENFFSSGVSPNCPPARY
mmetsp:Transcript_6329/g.9193  ORF Transcript_6329/g.9193 Transcript_6329/m.9193 type:complete len:120 (+) Transcript_6329:332-691(+)